MEQLARSARRVSPRLLGVGLLILLLASACDHRNPPWASPKTARSPSSVQETFDQIRTWHAEGAYASLRPYIHPAARESTIDLLIAVDELLAANTSARKAIEKACPAAESARLAGYDLSWIADSMELFSRRVVLVKVEERGDQATVTAEVSGRLPLITMPFQRLSGIWVYLPGTANPKLVEHLRAISRSLTQIAMRLNEQKLTPEQIDAEYRLLILPKQARIQRLAAAAT